MKKLGKMQRIYEVLENGEEKYEQTALYVTPKEFEEVFTEMIQNEYGYTPELKVECDISLWLPIEVTIKKEKTKEFQEFWDKLCADLETIQNKKEHFFGEDGFDFELGDKLLQMYLGIETKEEYYYHERGDDDYDFENEEDHLQIRFDENEIKPLARMITLEKKATVTPSEMLNAITSKNVTLVKRYIQEGYPLDVPVAAGMCAIHVASDIIGVKKDLEMVNVLIVLLEEGDDVNRPDKGLGYTPLGYAILNDDLETVKLLLAHGAKPDKINRRGESVKDIAKSTQMVELISR